MGRYLTDLESLPIRGGGGFPGIYEVWDLTFQIISEGLEGVQTTCKYESIPPRETPWNFVKRLLWLIALHRAAFFRGHTDETHDTKIQKSGGNRPG